MQKLFAETRANFGKTFWEPQPDKMQGAAQECNKDTMVFQKAKPFLRTWTKDRTITAVGSGNGKSGLFTGFSAFPSFSIFSIVCIYVRRKHNSIIFMAQNFSIFSIASKFTGNCALKIINIEEIL